MFLNLLESWKFISKEGIFVEQAELTLLTIIERFLKAAELSTRLITLVQKQLAEAKNELVGWEKK